VKYRKFFPYIISSSELNWLFYDRRCLSDVYVAWTWLALILNLYLLSPSVNKQPRYETQKQRPYPAGVRSRKGRVSKEGGKVASSTGSIHGKCCIPSVPLITGPTGWQLHNIAQYLLDKIVGLCLRIIQTLTFKCIKCGISVSGN